MINGILAGNRRSCPGSDHDRPAVARSGSGGDFRFCPRRARGSVKDQVACARVAKGSLRRTQPEG